MLVGQVAMQANTGTLAKCGEMVGKVCRLRRAVEKVSIGLCWRRDGTFVEAGEKGRDTDAAGDPDLMGRGNAGPQGATVHRRKRAKIKTALRAFEHQAAPRLK